MRRNKVQMCRALAVVGSVVVFGACGGGGAASLGPVPTAPATTLVATTVTQPPATTVTTATATTATTTTRPPATTTPPPVLVNGIPQVAATPAAAAVGAVVRIEGTGFTDAMWRKERAELWLAEKSGCNLYATAAHTVTVSAAGRLTGELTVPAMGNCKMTDVERPITSGSYRIAFRCTACFVGELVVTTTAGPCVSVGFTPFSDDVASSILAAGVGCVEAEALVRKVGAQVSSSGGPSRVEVDDWVCRRVRENHPAVGLDSSDFECVSGAKQVSFRRT